MKSPKILLRARHIHLGQVAWAPRLELLVEELTPFSYERFSFLEDLQISFSRALKKCNVLFADEAVDSR